MAELDRSIYRSPRPGIALWTQRCHLAILEMSERTSLQTPAMLLNLFDCGPTGEARESGLRLGVLESS